MPVFKKANEQLSKVKEEEHIDRELKECSDSSDSEKDKDEKMIDEK